MRVLITGMTGLVGGLVGRALAAHHDVQALDRHRADVTTLAPDCPAFAGIDVIVHAAGYQGDGWAEAMGVNVEGTRRVLEAARTAGVPRIIFVSSGAVQASLERREAVQRLVQQPANIPVPRPLIGEADGVAPMNGYGVSKVAGEALCRMYADAHGIRALVIRLGRVLASNRPDAARAAAVYLSHADLAALFVRAVEVDWSDSFAVIYATSANHSAFRDLTPARTLLGWTPRDGAPAWPLPPAWDPAPASPAPPGPVARGVRPGERPRILVVLTRYPQRSESYIKTELEALRSDWDLHVVSLNRADRPYDSIVPYVTAEERSSSVPPRAQTFRDATIGGGREPREWWEVDTVGRFGNHLLEVARRVRPHAIHTHYLHNAALAAYLAFEIGVPFTVRAHSYCLMHPSFRTAAGGRLEASDSSRLMAPFVADDHCLGVLTFPYTIPALRAAGLPDRKLVPCPPVLNLALFDGVRATGTGVVHGGPALLKKGMKRFLDLARLIPDREFNVYAVGHGIEALREYGEQTHSPAVIHADVPHEAMPEIYARHGWLVYTADPWTGNCGWPMSILEAQAVGLGVCAPNIHPHAADQLGGGGLMYHCIGDVVDHLARPYPDELRERGFANVRATDVRAHLHRLTELWEPFTRPTPG